MKFRYLKPVLSAALSVSLLFGATSCINDLDISPIDPQTSTAFEQDASFAKLYASLVLTGQTGSSGKPDIASDDEGMSGFYRSWFTLNEYCTDEIPERFAEEAEKLGFEKEAEGEFLEFRDYWISKSGKEASKMDWLATWRNWLRKAGRFKGHSPPTRRSFDDILSANMKAGLKFLEMEDG